MHTTLIFIQFSTYLLSSTMQQALSHVHLLQEAYILMVVEIVFCNILVSFIECSIPMVFLFCSPLVFMRYVIQYILQRIYIFQYHLFHIYISDRNSFQNSWVPDEVLLCTGCVSLCRSFNFLFALSEVAIMPVSSIILMLYRLIREQKLSYPNPLNFHLPVKLFASALSFLTLFLQQKQYLHCFFLPADR